MDNEVAKENYERAKRITAFAAKIAIIYAAKYAYPAVKDATDRAFEKTKETLDKLNHTKIKQELVQTKFDTMQDLVTAKRKNYITEDTLNDLAKQIAMCDKFKNMETATENLAVMNIVRETCKDLPALRLDKEQAGLQLDSVIKNVRTSHLEELCNLNKDPHNTNLAKAKAELANSINKLNNAIKGVKAVVKPDMSLDTMVRVR